MTGTAGASNPQVRIAATALALTLSAASITSPLAGGVHR